MQKRFTSVRDSYRGAQSADSDDNGGSQNHYSTTDIYFAAYLKTISVPFSHINRKDQINGRSRLEFVFDISNEENFLELKDDYFVRNVEIPANSFVENIKSFKSMCYN